MGPDVSSTVHLPSSAPPRLRAFEKRMVGGQVERGRASGARTAVWPEISRSVVFMARTLDQPLSA